MNESTQSPAPPQKGHPLPIITIKKLGFGNELVYHEEALKSILLRDDVRNKPVCVYSVGGPFRSGKSFLLSFFVRYLEENFDIESVKRASKGIRGFHWASGYRGITSGMSVWSEPFFATQNNREIAILLMDTQGTQDVNRSLQMAAGIFGLSLLISSVQIFNIRDKIDAGDLQEFELYFNIARCIQQDFKGKTFQHILFLIRDWKFYDVHDYGGSGGQKYMQEVLDVSGGELADEHKKVVEALGNCFEDSSCFLMPHPGSDVDRGNDTLGELEIAPVFLKQLEVLISDLLLPSKLVPKTILQKTVTAGELLDFFEQNFVYLKSGKTPEVVGMAKAMIGLFLENELEKILNSHTEQMDKLIKVGPLRKEAFKREANRIAQSVMQKFSESNVDQNVLSSYQDRLKAAIRNVEQKYEYFRQATHAHCVKNEENQVLITLFENWKFLSENGSLMEADFREESLAVLDLLLKEFSKCDLDESAIEESKICIKKKYESDFEEYNSRRQERAEKFLNLKTEEQLLDFESLIGKVASEEPFSKDEFPKKAKEMINTALQKFCGIPVDSSLLENHKDKYEKLLLKEIEKRTSLRKERHDELVRTVRNSTKDSFREEMKKLVEENITSEKIFKQRSEDVIKDKLKTISKNDINESAVLAMQGELRNKFRDQIKNYKEPIMARIEILLDGAEKETRDRFTKELKKLSEEEPYKNNEFFEKAKGLMKQQLDIFSDLDVDKASILKRKKLLEAELDDKIGDAEQHRKTRYQYFQNQVEKLTRAQFQAELDKLVEEGPLLLQAYRRKAKSVIEGALTKISENDIDPKASQDLWDRLSLEFQSNVKGSEERLKERMKSRLNAEKIRFRTNFKFQMGKLMDNAEKRDLAFDKNATDISDEFVTGFSNIPIEESFLQDAKYELIAELKEITKDNRTIAEASKDLQAETAMREAKRKFKKEMDKLLRQGVYNKEQFNSDVEKIKDSVTSHLRDSKLDAATLHRCEDRLDDYFSETFQEYDRQRVAAKQLLAENAFNETKRALKNLMDSIMKTGTTNLDHFDDAAGVAQKKILNQLNSFGLEKDSLIQCQGGLEDYFLEIVEEYKRKLLGTNTVRAGTYMIEFKRLFKREMDQVLEKKVMNRDKFKRAAEDIKESIYSRLKDHQLDPASLSKCENELDQYFQLTLWEYDVHRLGRLDSFLYHEITKAKNDYDDGLKKIDEDLKSRKIYEFNEFKKRTDELRKDCLKTIQDTITDEKEHLAQLQRLEKEMNKKQESYDTYWRKYFSVIDWNLWYKKRI